MATDCIWHAQLRPRLILVGYRDADHTFLKLSDRTTVDEKKKDSYSQQGRRNIPIDAMHVPFDSLDFWRNECFAVPDLKRASAEYLPCQSF